MPTKSDCLKKQDRRSFLRYQTANLSDFAVKKRRYNILMLAAQHIVIYKLTKEKQHSRNYAVISVLTPSVNHLYV